MQNAFDYYILMMNPACNLMFLENQLKPFPLFLNLDVPGPHLWNRETALAYNESLKI